MEGFYKLMNGLKIPKIMIGTYSIFGNEAKDVFRSAYEIGYRGIDCARYYKNEKDWGKAIKEFGVRRENIFIQTKVDYEEEKRDWILSKILKQLLLIFLQIILIVC